MKYTVKSMNEWLYPDSAVEAERHEIALCAVRGGSAGFQILLEGLEPGRICADFGAENSGLAFEIFRERAVKVEYNTGLHGFTADWAAARNYATREAPFWVFDAIEPIPVGGVDNADGTAAVYVSVSVDSDCEPGVYCENISVSGENFTARIAVNLTVADAVQPAETLNFTNWYSIDKICAAHDVELYSEEYWAILEKYGKLMRRMHQNVFQVQGDALRAGSVDESGRYVFDFSNCERLIRLFFGLGFKKIEGPIIFNRDNWDAADFKIDTPKGRVPALSNEGYEYASAFLTAWRKFLQKNGWYDKVVQHVGDEPHERAAADYRILSGIVRKFMPGVPLLDAIETHELQGSMDIWVPKNDYYSRNMAAMERLRSLGDEIWFYTCCIPGGRYCNRLLDMPLMRTRMLFWGAYRYRLTGFLHWGLNYWNDPKRPFEITCPLNSPTNRLPAGDTHILYPLGKEIFGSMRAELSRGGTEDHELLKALAEKDKSLADSICSTVFRAFDDCDNDAQAFDSLHDKLIEACAKNRI